VVAGAPPARCAFALIDVIVAVILLGVALASIISLSAQAVSSQRRGQLLAQAAALADEQLQLVLARGPDDYASRFTVDGRCDAPFDTFRYRLTFSTATTGEPYTVTAQILWNDGRAEQSLSIQTLMATREPAEGLESDPVRRPETPIDRSSIASQRDAARRNAENPEADPTQAAPAQTPTPTTPRRPTPRPPGGGGGPGGGGPPQPPPAGAPPRAQSGGPPR
jgi:Tfp pilus assembly protein PilV